MPDERNASGHESQTEGDDHEIKKQTIGEGETGAMEQSSPDGKSGTANKSRRPFFTVRFIHFLWRRRKWRRMRKLDHPGPNWAEITTVCLTLGIVVAAFIQVGIYWKQAGIMERSLQQNQQSIALNMGQTAIAGRNAKTAEDTLGEMKSGGKDTHTLAEAA